MAINLPKIKNSCKFIKKILDKSLIDEEINTEELLQLYKAKGSDILALAQAADQIRERQIGNKITYVLNHNINFTNICHNNCLFCAYSVKKEDSNAFLDISFKSWKEKLSAVTNYNITEVCIQGGINPELTYQSYIDILKIVKNINPTLHIHAFSPEEIKNATALAGHEIEDTLIDFRKNGLGSIPGTAAEILDDSIRKKICSKKLTTNEWIDIITLAHDLKIPTTSTILIGHIENPHHWVNHLKILKDIQVKTNGFTEFVPLLFISKNTKLKQHKKFQLNSLSILEIIKFYAASRLYLGKFIPNIQTSWVKLGIDIAKITLLSGCNDFGGTLFEENITKSAGGEFGDNFLPKQIINNINDLNRIPQQRSTIYEYL